MGYPPAVKSKELQSWKEIAAYLGRDVRTVIRWEKEKGLPVRRVSLGAGRPTVFADTEQIDRWLSGFGQDVQGNQVANLPPKTFAVFSLRFRKLLMVGAAATLLTGAFFIHASTKSRPGRLRRPLEFATADYDAVGPTSVITADFDHDGNLDLAVANSNDDSIELLYGDGKGSFPRKVRIPEQRRPERLAAADLNSDGLIDLIVTNRGTGDVVVLLAQPSGGYRESFRWNSSGRSRWVTTEDLNHDGKLDLIVACSTAQKIAVLMARGDGTFTDIRTYDSFGEPSAVLAADFNQDGNLELISADYQIGFGRTVSLYLGSGDGTFRARQPYPTGLGPLAIAVADLNGDHHPDLVTADYQDSVSILLGSADGFEKPKLVEAGNANGFVVAGDFDHDGFQDLLVTGEHSNSAHIFFGDGHGGFSKPEFLKTGKYPDAIATGDFNRDGKLDFAVANTYGDSVTVYINRGQND